MIDKIAFGKRLQEIAHASGSSYTLIANELGITKAIFNNYINGLTFPSIDILIRIADLFSIPMDYLLGRCDKETADNILKNFSQHYEDLRRQEFEGVLFRKSPNFINIPDGYDAPYPYNLIEDILGYPVESLLTEDQKNGLEMLLTRLTPKEEMVLKFRYSDGMTLLEIGNKINVTQERVRQIVLQALRKLRVPARKNYIINGAVGNDLIKEYSCKLKELKQREAVFEERIKSLTEEKSLYDEVYPYTKNQYSEAFMDLSFSVRVFNCLARSNIHTVHDLIQFIEDGKLLSIRNLGKKSADEIIQKLKEYNGIDYSKYLIKE